MWSGFNRRQGKVTYWTAVNTMVNLRYYKKRRICWPSEQLSVSPGLFHCSLSAVFSSVSRVLVLTGAVLLGALVIFAIVIAATLGGEKPVTGAAVLDIVPFIDG